MNWRCNCDNKNLHNNHPKILKGNIPILSDVSCLLVGLQHNVLWRISPIFRQFERKCQYIIPIITRRFSFVFSVRTTPVKSDYRIFPILLFCKKRSFTRLVTTVIYIELCNCYFPRAYVDFCNIFMKIQQTTKCV